MNAPSRNVVAVGLAFVALVLLVSPVVGALALIVALAALTERAKDLPWFDLLLAGSAVAFMHDWLFVGTDVTSTVTAGFAAIAVVLCGARRADPTWWFAALGATCLFGSTLVTGGWFVWLAVAATGGAAVATRYDPRLRRPSVAPIAVTADMMAVLVGSATIGARAITHELDLAVAPAAVLVVVAAARFVRHWPRLRKLVAAQNTRMERLAAPEPTVEIDAGGRVLDTNDAAVEMDLAVGVETVQRLDDASFGLLTETQQRTSTQGGTIRVELALQRQGSGRRELRVDVTSLGDDPASWMLELLDVTAPSPVRPLRRREVQRPQAESHTDPLTGVCSRKGLLDELHRRLHSGDTVAYFVHLDGLEAVTDEHGHDASDAVLVAIAQRVAKAVGPVWLVGRLEDDEFLIVGPAEESVDGDLDELRALIEEPVQFRTTELKVTATVGCEVRQRGADTAELVRATEEAMTRAKRRRAAVSEPRTDQDGQLRPSEPEPTRTDRSTSMPETQGTR